MLINVMNNDYVSFQIQVGGSPIKGRVVLEKCLWDGVLVVVMNLLQELAFW